MRLKPPRLFLLRLLKRWAPTSLWGRSLLIIVLPIAIMQVAVTWAFFDAHWQTVTSSLAEGLAGDVSWLVQSYEADPSPTNLEHLQDRAERTLDLSVALQPGKALPRFKRYSLFGPVDWSIKRALEAHLDQPFWFDTTRYPAYVDIRVAVPQGVLRIIAPRDRAFATQGHMFILWMTVATVLLRPPRLVRCSMATVGGMPKMASTSGREAG